MSLVTIKIHADNLIHNFSISKNKTPLLGAVVKADAYGLGAEYVTEILRQNDCKIFFVASALEGKLLRTKFSNIDIYVFDGFVDYQTILDYKLKPVLNTIEQVSLFAKTNNHGAILHIDTGMNRLGIPYSELHKINSTDIQLCNIDYIMTHFSDSENNADFTKKQTELLMRAADYLKIPKISIANSGGILWHTPPADTICLGRAGIALYGGIQGDNLRPVVSVSGKILQKKYVQANEPIGYSGTFVTQNSSLLLTVAGGYADGIMRSLSQSGFCGFMNGYKIPLVGRVSMDSCIFDASHVPTDIINSSTDVEFFGLNNSIQSISYHAGTIPYEFLTNLSRRANRIFIKE